MIAYELRESYRDNFLGGVINAGERDLNIAEELEKGNGTITVADDADVRVITALDNYPALKRTTAPDGDPAVEGEDKYLRSRVTALRADAKARDLDGAGEADKATLVAALAEHDRILAADEAVAGPLTIDALAAAAAEREEA